MLRPHEIIIILKICCPLLINELNVVDRKTEFYLLVCNTNLSSSKNE